MVKRRGRRRRPSLDNLLRQHSEEIALGVGLAPDEEELQDDDKRGLKALFELVGNGSEHLRVGHINPFLEKLGVFMDSGKVSDLFKLHQLQLSPAPKPGPGCKPGPGPKPRPQPKPGARPKPGCPEKFFVCFTSFCFVCLF